LQAVWAIEQGQRPLHADEAAALRCSGNRIGFVRETFLGERDEPLVYGRVAMPEETYEAMKPELDTLGSRPIGETMLYGDATVTRSAFEVRRLSASDDLLSAVPSERIGSDPWARRSTFTIAGRSLLVTEVFLSRMPAYHD
jgi:chorismate lyase